MMRTAEHEATNWRTLTGFVSSSASYGPGWYCVNIGTGAYILRFVPVFKSMPNIVAQMVTTGGFILLLNADPTGAQINTYATNAGSQNNSFMFVARGLVMK